MKQVLKNNFTSKEILAGSFGLERESLRVTKNGKLALTKHPEALGDKAFNPFITTDFSESQVELITPVLQTVEEAHEFLENLYDIVALEIGDELLWPQSMPCDVEDENEIPIANFSDEFGRPKGDTSYREYLKNKYGARKQLISGIHYNFSFDENFIYKLWSLNSNNSKLSYSRFKDQIYLKVARNYLRYRWVLIYLLGASPLVHSTYEQECNKVGNEMSQINCEGLAISYRNSACGYENKTVLYGNYTSVTEYTKSICNFIRNGSIESHKEFYSSIRLKPYSIDNFLESLLKDGIKYIEVRSIDINPFEKSGVNLLDLKFIHLLLIYCLVKEEDEFELWQEEALSNQHFIAVRGQNNISLMKNGKSITLGSWLDEIFVELTNINSEFELEMEDVLEHIKLKISNPKNLPSVQIAQQIKEQDFIKSHLKIAQQFKENAFNNRFKLKGYEDLELSTQILIKEALKQGISCEIVDRFENFIKLKKDSHVEYIKQATKTGLDSYITYLIMENKVVTKQVLEENNIPVPKGIEFSNIENANLEEFLAKACVVKPKSTNFGIGISIFTTPPTYQDLITAIELAFEHDNTVIIEEFINGKEYRFLVIGDEVVGILNRQPANVIGDGKSTIEQLVYEKNKDSLRGKGYKTPLEKIMLDEHVDLFLKQSNLTTKYIPSENETVYLRENSNISTGGDSIDYTDKIGDEFKMIAVKAALAVGAKICGVDMIIEDYKNPDRGFGIIELNFNPAIHIHSFPYKGEERQIAKKILELMNF
ncbi:MAG: bifunctional glutamate--cysteine ligase/glutathione synthetase [Epulopiscium sp. Nele67-Bin005]|nr:MAG: bifunctional glutamate--cysteine ligase/glutathione synthetase [Epulopiscium sp. Nele67-Bin005]